MKLTIGTKVLAGYLILGAAMGGVAVAALVGFARLQQEYELVRRQVDQLRHTRAVALSVSDAETAVRGFLSTGEARFLEPLTPARRARGEALAAARALTADADEQTQLELIESALSEAEAINDTLVARRRRGPLANLSTALQEQKAVMDFARGLLAAYEGERDAQLSAGGRRLLAAPPRYRTFTALLLAAAAIVGLGGGATIAHRITRPLRALAAASRDLAAGRLECRVAARGQDEVAELSRAFNAMAARLEGSTTQLRATLKELETPVIPVAEGLVALPIVGLIDGVRACQITGQLLAGVVRYHARAVVIDISAIHTVDTAVVKHLTEASQAVRLMGARCVISGISPEVAERLVALGVTLGEVPTVQTMQDAIHQMMAAAGAYPRPA